VTADAGTIAARERVAGVLERLERVQLGVIVVAPPDPVRLEARDRARQAAIVAGRSGLLDEAAEAARTTAMRIFARSGFSGTWVATEMSASVASASDRAAAAAAFEEAVTAAVVADLVDDETREILTATTDELIASNALPTPGSLASLTARVGGPTPSSRGGVLLPTAVTVAVVAGVLVTGSVVGALAGGFVVAGIGWLAGRRSRVED
jgi:hypothetical protein